MDSIMFKIDGKTIQLINGKACLWNGDIDHAIDPAHILRRVDGAVHHAIKSRG